MAHPRIVAIAAPCRQSGKSTVAHVLVDEYGYTPFSFALPIKTMFISLCMHAEIPKEYYPRILDGDMKERAWPALGGLSLRTFAEGVGTEWGRKMFSESLWVDIGRQKIARMLDRGERVVIEDCRFPNEANVAHDLGGEVWYVTRPDHNPPRLPSEGHMDAYPCDWIIYNGGTVEDLKGNVRRQMP